MTTTYLQLAADLQAAYLSARINTRWTEGQLRFEYHCEEELFDLAHDIYERRYQPRPGTCFIINRPVKREIFASEFRDRVVHHLIYHYLQPVFERFLIHDSYSCRVGRGTSAGIRRLEHHLRSVSCNYTRPAYVLTMDLSGYFMSIDKDLLWKVVSRILDKYQRRATDDTFDRSLVDYLLRVTIYRDIRVNCSFHGKPSDWDGLPDNKSLLKAPSGVGLPIGDLTSQMFSNIFLNELDQYIKRELHCRHYGRYVDDFYIVDTDPDRLRCLVPVISAFLRDELHLTLHPHKVRLQVHYHGVRFLGAYLMPFRTYLCNRSLHNLRCNVSDRLNHLPARPLTKDECTDLENSYASWKGHLMHLRAHFVEQWMDRQRERFVQSRGIASTQNTACCIQNSGGQGSRKRDTKWVQQPAGNGKETRTASESQATLLPAITERHVVPSDTSCHPTRRVASGCFQTVHPASGNRNNSNGSLNNDGSNGNYWSSSPNSQTNGYNLNFNSSSVNPSNNNNRANGFPVRCIAEHPLCSRLCFLLFLLPFFLTGCGGSSTPTSGPTSALSGGEGAQTIEVLTQTLTGTPADSLHIVDWIGALPPDTLAGWVAASSSPLSLWDDPNSPCHNDEWMLPVLQCVLLRADTLGLDVAVRERLLFRYRQALQNRPGHPANDVPFVITQGRDRGATASLYGLLHGYRLLTQPPLVLLCLYNPGCAECARLGEALVQSPLVDSLLDRDLLTLVAVNPDEPEDDAADTDAAGASADGDALVRLLDRYGADRIIIGRDVHQTLRTRGTYSLRAIPSLYLLAPDGTVLAKDIADIGTLEGALEAVFLNPSFD